MEYQASESEVQFSTLVLGLVTFTLSQFNGATKKITELEEEVAKLKAENEALKKGNTQV